MPLIGGPASDFLGWRDQRIAASGDFLFMFWVVIGRWERGNG